jgi:hypothetical protein
MEAIGVSSFAVSQDFHSDLVGQQNLELRGGIRSLMSRQISPSAKSKQAASR